MKRMFLAGVSAALAAYMMVGVIAFARPNTSQRRALPLGRYTCVRVSDSAQLPDLKLVSRDKYESEEKTGVYAYEAGSGKIEWLTGAISRQLIGFYVPKGTDNSSQDTIIIREKRDVDEGNNRDLWRCNLAE